MSIIKKAIKHHKDGILLNRIFRRLKKTNIYLFYLVEEGLFDKSASILDPGLHPLEIVKLKQSEIKEIAAKSERDYSEEDMLKMLSDGSHCLCAKYKGQIVSYVWYNLTECSEPSLRFKLLDNEAYIYGARTFSAYRGNALAPFLRQKLYEHLNTIGHTRLYSITDYENTSSIMFKRKLKAKNRKLYIKFRILGKFKRNILIRSYKS